MRVLAWILALGLVTAAVAGDFPDPFVTPVPEGWMAFATNTGDRHVPVLRSTDLETWKNLGDAMPRLACWVRPGHTWAPSVLRRRGRWLLYYTAREAATDLQAIGCAVAERPEGPYVDDRAAPLISTPDEGGAIDASPFVDTDGRAYLLWKSDGNSQGKPTHLLLRALSPDGRSLVGPTAALLTRDAPWEEPLIEAPSLVRAGGRYHLFYSANWWESDRYGVGHAVADRLRGPYRKTSVDGPVFGSQGGFAGPGGQELFRGPGGEWRMAFHAWKPGLVGYGAGGARRLHVIPVRFAGEKPVFARERISPARAASGR